MFVYIALLLLWCLCNLHRKMDPVPAHWRSPLHLSLRMFHSLRLHFLEMTQKMTTIWVLLVVVIVAVLSLLLLLLLLLLSVVVVVDVVIVSVAAVLLLLLSNQCRKNRFFDPKKYFNFSLNRLCTNSFYLALWPSTKSF